MFGSHVYWKNYIINHLTDRLISAAPNLILLHCPLSSGQRFSATNVHRVIVQETPSILSCAAHAMKHELFIRLSFDTTISSLWQLYKPAQIN